MPAALHIDDLRLPARRPAVLCPPVTQSLKKAKPQLV